MVDRRLDNSVRKMTEALGFMFINEFLSSSFDHQWLCLRQS